MRAAAAATSAKAKALEAARAYAASVVTCPEMVYIPGGTFWMGSALDDPLAFSDEQPRHQVTVSPYWIAKVPVTQKLFADVMGKRPGYKVDDNAPVSLVSWLGAIEFCNLLSKRHGLSPAYRKDAGTWTVQANSNGYRLPSEAEWEYAARGRDGRAYPWGNEAHSLEVCWGVVGSANWSGPYPVGGHPAGASPFGILDMVGNVRELVADGYAPYPDGPAANPQGPDLRECDSRRVLRGIGPRAASRSHVAMDVRSNRIGFRVARGNFPPVPNIRSTPPRVPHSNVGAVPRTQSRSPPQPMKPHKESDGMRQLPVPPSFVNGNRKVEELREGVSVRCDYCAAGIMVRGDIKAHLAQVHALFVDDRGRIVSKLR